jgi:hypothetical protein
MRVPEENVGDYVRRIALDDLVEQIGAVRQGIGAIPPGQNL